VAKAGHLRRHAKLLDRKRSIAVAHHLEQVAVGIEKVHAVVIAPVDRRRALDARRGEPRGRGGEVGAAYAECVMAAAKRMLNARAALGRGKRRARDTEERKVLPAAIEQHLVAQVPDDAEAEDLGVEALGAPKVGDLDAEMIQPLKFHHAVRPLRRRFACLADALYRVLHKMPGRFFTTGEPRRHYAPWSGARSPRSAPPALR